VRSVLCWTREVRSRLWNGRRPAPASPSRHNSNSRTNRRREEPSRNPSPTTAGLRGCARTISTAGAPTSARASRWGVDEARDRRAGAIHWRMPLAPQHCTNARVVAKSAERTRSIIPDGSSTFGANREVRKSHSILGKAHRCDVGDPTRAPRAPIIRGVRSCATSTAGAAPSRELPRARTRGALARLCEDDIVSRESHFAEMREHDLSVGFGIALACREHQ
jgi:hypothetical protein